MKRLSENSVINIKNKSFSVTAELEVGDDPAQGVLIAQGGAFGGWALYARWAGRSLPTTSWASTCSTTEATEAMPLGIHQVRMEFAYDGGGLAKGGTSPSSTTVKLWGREDRSHPANGLLGR